MKEIPGFIANISPNQIVDRDKYIDHILSIFNESSKSNIVIIMAESAIGKSALVDKLLDNKLLKQETIRVRTLPLNQSQKNEEWEFLNSIFSAIKEKYHSTAYSFSEYIYSLKNKTANKDMLNYVISTLYSKDISKNSLFIHSFSFLSLLWFFKLGNFDVQNIVDDNSIDANRIKAQYIKTILKKKNILLSIDNIQNIDKNSLRELLNIINETKGNNPQFLFEYTLTQNNNKDNCNKLGESFQTTAVKTNIILLEKLEAKYIVDVLSKHMLVPNSNWDFNISIQKQYIKNNNGNIREMIDYGICFNEKSKTYPEVCKDSLKNILSLSEYAKQVLSFVICSDSSISRNFLKQISLDIKLNIDTAIQELLDRLLVIEKDDKINLSHASLADVWRNNPNIFSVFDNISYSYLETYYLKILEKEEVNKTSLFDQAWINLINIYANFKTEKLLNLFQYIEVDSKILISQDNSWKYINRILEKIKCNYKDYYKLTIDIIRYCFETELYEEGFNLIIDIEKQLDTDIIKLYHAMFLSALDKHKENIEYCKNILGSTKTNAYVYYNIKLISLSSYRSLHILKECYHIHDELYHDKKFKDTKEYAFFLRLCEMYLDRNKSIKYLHKSVKIFEKNNNYIQAGKSLISYSYILASQGRLKKAQQKIMKAEKYLENKRMGIHMFLVNKAAINLYCGNYSEEVWEILNKSEITAVVPFDKLAIITNKLVWCIENKESNRHEMLIDQANELLQLEPDRHIHALVYYNIYYLLKSRNIENNKFYFEKAKEMAPYCKPVYARIYNSPTPETRFALRFNWHVCFLAYWTYDL